MPEIIVSKYPLHGVVHECVIMGDTSWYVVEFLDNGTVRTLVV